MPRAVSNTLPGCAKMLQIYHARTGMRVVVTCEPNADSALIILNKIHETHIQKKNLFCLDQFRDKPSVVLYLQRLQEKPIRHFALSYVLLLSSLEKKVMKFKPPFPAAETVGRTASLVTSHGRLSTCGRLWFLYFHFSSSSNINKAWQLALIPVQWQLYYTISSDLQQSIQYEIGR